MVRFAQDISPEGRKTGIIYWELFIRVSESETEFPAVSDKEAVMVKFPAGMELVSMEVEKLPFWQVVEASVALLYFISTRRPFSEQVPETTVFN